MKHRCIVLFCSFFLTTHAEIANEHKKELSHEYYELAHHLQQIGNKNKAKELYTKAISINADNAAAYGQLGTLYYEENNIPQAITHFTQSLIYQPNASIHFNLGQCYSKQQQWSTALTEFQKTIALEPHHERAYVHLGIAHEKLHLHDEAIAAYKNAIMINPQCFEACYNLGTILKHLERLEESLESYRQAHALQPHNMQVTMDLANTLNMLNHNQESLELYEQIVEKNPNMLSALYNFGFTLKKMGHLDQAITVYQQVLAKKPDYAPVHFSLSSIYLTLGDFEQGWQEYEWRWKAYNEEAKKFETPSWTGQDLSNCTLFIYAEQGLGDTLQFIRYVQHIKNTYNNVRIIFQSQDPLVCLLKHQPYIDQVLSRREIVPHFDYHIPLMSLPYIFKTRVDTIPTNIPYIELPQHLINEWKEKPSADTHFKIGICWQGNARYNTQSLRRAVALKSIQLNQLASLFDIPGVSIYCLQQVDGVDQIATCPFKDKLITFDSSFDQQHGRFMDTAAVMKQLNLVISVDTGICHLAGALNVPTWILLPNPADWRWLLYRNDSPWYPSVRLFRQQQPEDWQTVIAHVAQELQDVVEHKKCPITPIHHHQQFLHAPSNDQLLFYKHLINALA